MFNNNVTNILGQINSITNSLILKYPETIVNSPAGDMLVSINMQNLDPDSFEDTGIYNLTEFLNTLKLVGEEREVTLSDKIFFISDGDYKLEYISNSISLLAEYDKSPKIFESTANVPTVAEFQLTSDEIKKVKQASSVFKDLEEVVFTSQDGEINISLSASNKFNAKSNKFGLNKPADTTKEFSIRIPVDNFNALPASDYTFYVKYNDAKNAYRLMLKSNEIEDFKILMTVKK